MISIFCDELDGECFEFGDKCISCEYGKGKRKNKELDKSISYSVYVKRDDVIKALHSVCEDACPSKLCKFAEYFEDAIFEIPHEFFYERK